MRFLQWMWHPQSLVCFMVLCLCAAAWSSVLRSASAMPIVSPRAHSGMILAQEPVSPPDCSVKPCLALTFDDGPNDQYTPQILDILARQQVKATFFLVGSHVAGREAIVQRQYQEGHEIGNHSWNHPDLSKVPPAEVDNQLRMTQQAIARANVPAPRVMRPPYGAVDNMVAARTGLTIVRWNIDPEDWKIKDPLKIDENMLLHSRPGGIILLHDTEQTTVAALEPALNILKQHYQFVTASQLLGLSPGDQGQYFGH